MNNVKKHIVLGKEYETPNTVHYQVADTADIGWGISVGTTQKANDDCIGVSTSENEKVLAIADGHWGNEASELAIKKVTDLLDSKIRFPKDNETRARFYSLFEHINMSLFEMAMTNPGSPTPETTLIVCHLRETSKEKLLFWSSFGDSYLFVLRDGELRQLNSLNQYWLGMLSKLSENAEKKVISLKYLSGDSHYVGVADGLETGIENVKSGDIIFLCTDGLIGSDTEISDDMANNLKIILTSAAPLDAKVNELVLSALSRGEIDNVSCVVAYIK